MRINADSHSKPNIVPTFARNSKTRKASASVLEAYFQAVESNMVYDECFEVADKRRPFTTSTVEKELRCFDHNEKRYAVMAYDHHNGHFSGMRDRCAVFGISVREF